MLADATPRYKPQPAGMYIHVEDTDKTYHTALREGATSLNGATETELCLRSGVRDEFDNTWWLATP